MDKSSAKGELLCLLYVLLLPLILIGVVVGGVFYAVRDPEAPKGVQKLALLCGFQAQIPAIDGRLADFGRQYGPCQRGKPRQADLFL